MANLRKTPSEFNTLEEYFKHAYVPQAGPALARAKETTFSLIKIYESWGIDMTEPGNVSRMFYAKNGIDLDRDTMTYLKRLSEPSMVSKKEQIIAELRRLWQVKNDKGYACNRLSRMDVVQLCDSVNAGTFPAGSLSTQQQQQTISPDIPATQGRLTRSSAKRARGSEENETGPQKRPCTDSQTQATQDEALNNADADIPETLLDDVEDTDYSNIDPCLRPGRA
ncbi:MAG: hypothetical protein LQ340_005268 [Diploschistes diacapsis]|nr:MAG: hypothetical protein LQ340_005268 [Diploschistes diacapsis]